MNKRHFLIAAGLTTVGALAGFGVKALADGIPSPNPLYYSGTLTEGGMVVNGTRAITVNLWPDATSAGMPLCQTVASNAPVSGGRFRIALASSCKAIVNQNANVYVEVIDGATSLGRSPIGAVPYAVEAERASGAAGALAQQVVPSGAVMAFNLTACPTGWSAFAAAGGRAIIGVNASGGNGLSQRNLGATLGEEEHTMTANEMPSHAHSIAEMPHSHQVGPQNGVNQQGQPAILSSNGSCGLTCTNPSFVIVFSPTVTETALTGIAVTQPAGGGSPFNNMQPSLALLYCQKN